MDTLLEVHPVIPVPIELADSPSEKRGLHILHSKIVRGFCVYVFAREYSALAILLFKVGL